jgi:hypothetical protein
MPRIAIIISHANREPFLSIIRDFHRPTKLVIEEFIFETFYFEGRQSRKSMNFLREKVEKLRYSNFWPILRLYDSFFLWLAGFFLPTSKLVTDRYGRKILKTNIPEDQRHIALKVYSALTYCNESNYDFVLRVTSNSLINIYQLMEFLRNREASVPLYSGREVRTLNRPSFISGSFLILNKSAIRLLLSSRYLHNYGVLDDVAIGRIFARCSANISKEFCKSVDFPNLSTLSKFCQENFVGVMHYRCKSMSNPRIDSEIISALKKRLAQAQILYV